MSGNMGVVLNSLVDRSHRCISFIQAGLVQDWVKTSRVLLIVEHQSLHGLLILNPDKSNVTCKNDLTIETVLPIDENFVCEFEFDSKNASYFDPLASCTFLRIVYANTKLLFEMEKNSTNENFVRDANRLMSGYLRRTAFSDFSWLDQYKAINSYGDPHSVSSPSLTRPLISKPFEIHPPLVEVATTAHSSHSMGDLLTDSPSSMTLNNGSSVAASSSSYQETPKYSKFYPGEEILDADLKNLPRDSMAMGLTTPVERDLAVQAQMMMREEEYIDYKTFRIYIGTWNVNGQNPQGLDCSTHWLACDPSPPDIYAIGFQELDLSKEAFLFSDSPREEEWLRVVRQSLHPGAMYQKLRHIRLIGMMIVVFIKAELVHYVSNVAAETVGTGILGKMGNKGGVAVRFDFHNSSLCFVNCHLAAHVEEYERRNQDYHEINARLAFQQFRPPKHIKDHNQIYWFGDLNYRVMNLDSDQVKSLLRANAFDLLLSNDQLTQQRNLKHVFKGFTEQGIRHMPTYKYDPGTNNWDSSEKNRPPAWCDRVLYSGGPTEQLTYRSHPNMLISDHKPVSALFQAQIQSINEKKYREVHQEVMRQLDKFENEFLPQLDIDRHELVFPQVTFRDVQTQSVTVANSGLVPVKFSFIRKPNEKSYCKPWLSISPYICERLMPGQRLDIEFQVSVECESAHGLNAGTDRLDDVLILHLDGGRDIFISISASYRPSCFGCTLETLVRLDRPVSQVPADVLRDLESGKNLSASQVLWDIPKEVWLLVDALYKHGLDQEDLFTTRGLNTEMYLLRDKLDSEFPQNGLTCKSVHSVAESLLLFLGALGEPVICYALYPKAIESIHSFLASRQIINELPVVHRNVFNYLMAYLKELIRHSSFNRVDTNIIASSIGDVILRSPSSLSGARSAESARKQHAQFVHNFLVNDYMV